MHKIAVVYHSASGTTRQLAYAVISGAEAAGAQVLPVEIKAEDIIQGRYINNQALNSLAQADAVIFGSPTFMGSVSAEFKTFADASSELWFQRAWKDKLAAGFTIGINLNGDQLSTLQYMQIFAAQHAMLWVSLDIQSHADAQQRNRLGAHSGLIAQTSGEKLDQRDLQTARYLGERMSALLTRYKSNTPVELSSLQTTID